MFYYYYIWFFKWFFYEYLEKPTSEKTQLEDIHKHDVPNTQNVY
jgi:hypothetical protein